LVTRSYDRIGVLVASSPRADFAARVSALAGVEGVGPNMWTFRADGASIDVGVAAVAPDDALVEIGSGPSGDDAFSFYQWSLDAIDAPEAWAMGARGNGVRVAVLDTGINPDHPDLAANVNMALSASFIDGEDVDVRPLPPPPRPFAVAHGTHVAGIIGAADNGLGIIGVAPDVEIVPIKVLSQVNGFGTWDAIIGGILHAADVGANVINMSLGGRLDRRGIWDNNGTADPADDVFITASEVEVFVQALQRAIDYARARGAVVVAAAGNAANDGEHDADRLILPATLPGVVSVAATGPIGWGPAGSGRDPDADLDLLAYYTNYGYTDVDLSAPGGNGGLNQPANWLDWVYSTVPLGWTWASGTSMAAPHVSGVAALIIGQLGAGTDPADVERILRESADDLGKAGRDPGYGHGRVNALKAVK
jgi:subtilisin family serine protease